MEIYGKPSIQYNNLPVKFNNYGLKVNTKDSWVDNDYEIAIWYGYHEINQGSVDLLSHFTKVKCDSWT